MTTGQKLRAARQRLNKTQAQVASEIGVTQPMVHAWESDAATPRSTRLRKVADVYGLDVAELVPEAAA